MTWGPCPPCVAVVGSTASGKSVVAMAAARHDVGRRAGVEIVAVDAMQVYRGMDIGTAKPTPAAAKPTPSPTASPAPEPPKKATDVKLKTSITQGAQVSENVMYLQGTRQRVEFPGIVSIDQCAGLSPP